MMAKISAFFNGIIKELKLSKKALVVFSVCIFMGVCIFISAQANATVNIKKAQYEALQAEYNQQLQLNAELSAMLEESEEEYITHVAREKLGFVLPGERVFIISSGN